MQKPKMVIFDYGQTLVDEEYYDERSRLKGTEAVLAKCFADTGGVTAAEVQKLADELNDDIGRNDPATRHLLYTAEIHNHPFQNYLYGYFNLTATASQLEIEKTFWDIAAPGKPSVHIRELLSYLGQNNIRTAVISNISFGGETVADRINTLLPYNRFEFIIASSEYVFRKPHRRIFEIAARKARLDPRDIWYCGDNIVPDVNGSRGAGYTPVWYRGATKNADQAQDGEAGCLVIYDWLELIDVFNKLM